MTPSAIILSLLGLLITSALTVWATLRADRKSREHDREQQLEQVRGLLQTMVVEKIEAAFNEIAKHEVRITDTEKAHAHLLGFLQGKGCTVPEFCTTDLEGGRK